MLLADLNNVSIWASGFHCFLSKFCVQNYTSPPKMILLFHVDNYTSGSMVDADQMAKSHVPLQTKQNTCSCMFVPDTPGTLAVGDVRGFTYQKH
jgi:hypothetical protein